MDINSCSWKDLRRACHLITPRLTPVTRNYLLVTNHTLWLVWLKGASKSTRDNNLNNLMFHTFLDTYVTPIVYNTAQYWKSRLFKTRAFYLWSNENTTSNRRHYSDLRTKFIPGHLLQILITFWFKFAVRAAEPKKDIYKEHFFMFPTLPLSRRQRPLLHSPFSRFMNHFSKRLIYNLATPLLLSSWKPFSLFLLYVKKYEEKYCSRNINYLSHSGRKFTSCLHLRHTEFMQFPSACAERSEWPISCFRTGG